MGGKGAVALGTKFLGAQNFCNPKNQKPPLASSCLLSLGEHKGIVFAAGPPVQMMESPAHTPTAPGCHATAGKVAEWAVLGEDQGR